MAARPRPSRARDAPDNPALGRAGPDTRQKRTNAANRAPSRSGTGPDIGAFEPNQPEPKPPPVGTTFLATTTSDVTADHGQPPCARRWPWPMPTTRTKDRIEFAAEVQGQTITLAGSQLTVNSDVTVDGGAGVTIDADQASRVLLVQRVGTDDSSPPPDRHRRPSTHEL